METSKENLHNDIGAERVKDMWEWVVSKREGRGGGGGIASAWLDTQFFLFKVYINDLFLQAEIGQRDGLSDVDARQANLLYGCAGKNYIYIYIFNNYSTRARWISNDR